MSKLTNKNLLDAVEPVKSESEVVIHLLKEINSSLQDLVKLSKDIDYKLWAYAKQDGVIK